MTVIFQTERYYVEPDPVTGQEVPRVEIAQFQHDPAGENARARALPAEVAPLHVQPNRWLLLSVAGSASDMAALPAPTRTEPSTVRGPQGDVEIVNNIYDEDHAIWDHFSTPLRPTVRIVTKTQHAAVEVTTRRRVEAQQTQVAQAQENLKRNVRAARVSARGELAAAGISADAIAAIMGEND